MKKGVWRHTAWQLHENWCVNSALVDRENSWSHQSATLLVSPLTQIEFMGDTCRMFPHPRSYYKTIKCFIFTADLLSVRTRHVKWALSYVFIICKDEKHFYKIFFFFFFSSCQTDVDGIYNFCNRGKRVPLPGRLRWLSDISSHYRPECHRALPPAMNNSRSHPCEAFPLLTRRNLLFVFQMN